MNYELHMRPPQNQYKLFTVPCCYFSWLMAFPPFFSIPDVPLEVRRKILQIRNASNHLILNNSNSTAVGSW